MSSEQAPLPHDGGEERAEEKPKRRRTLRWISLVLLVLVAAAFYFNLEAWKKKDPTFSVLSILSKIPKGDSKELARQVTFFAITPLTDAVDRNHDKVADGLSTTAYTKIGYKAVPAAGNLDFTLYEYDAKKSDGKGREIQTWHTIVLPDSESVAWGKWPLGGWELVLNFSKGPPAKQVYLEATYTKPDGHALLPNGQGPIRLMP